MLFKFPWFSCVLRPVVAYENLTFLQIHVAVNFDLDISTGTHFSFQTNSEVKYALPVVYAISLVILNFSDLHDKFCEACGEADMVEECLKLLQGLKMCTHNLSDTWVSPSLTERMKMTSRPPCLRTRQNGRDFKIRYGEVLLSQNHFR